MGQLILRKFVAPEIVFGDGSRHLAGKYASNMGVSRALVVTDPGIIAAGWVDDVTRSLEEAGLEYLVYSAVTPNPRSNEVMRGADFYRSENCNGIVAIGGGSPMDCAKGIGIISSNGGQILNFEGVDTIDFPCPPLIFIPTTAGASSDVSQFAIIANTVERVKISIISKSLVPDIALVDPETTTTMDMYLTACTGIDALTHAVEAFVSRGSSAMTDIHALAAIRLLNANLEQIVKNPADMDVRRNITLGSMEAGLAFSNAILGAVHAMSHSLGGFLDLPHGECNSILFEHVVGFNYDVIPEKYDQIAMEMGLEIKGLPGRKKKALLMKRIVELKKAVGITNKLGAVGVSIGDIGILSQNACKDACLATNPRSASIRDIEVIYEESL